MRVTFDDLDNYNEDKIQQDAQSIRKQDIMIILEDIK